MKYKNTFAFSALTLAILTSGCGNQECDEAYKEFDILVRNAKNNLSLCKERKNKCDKEYGNTDFTQNAMAIISAGRTHLNCLNETSDLCVDAFVKVTGPEFRALIEKIDSCDSIFTPAPDSFDESVKEANKIRAYR